MTHTMTETDQAPRRLRTEVWLFFIAILILNSLFVAGIGEGLIPKHYFSKGRLVLLLGTLVGAIVVMRGPRAVLELIKPLLVWRISPLWFIAAFLWPILFAVTFVIGRSFVMDIPLEIIGGGIKLFSREGFLLNMLIVALVGEIVWVGYAIRNLSKFHPLAIAALITGTFWTLWWGPMMIYQIGIVPGLDFLGLWMNMVGIAFFCAFFYTLTRSGLVILVMQFCYNGSSLAFPILPNAEGLLSYQIYSALYMITGFLFLTVLLPIFRRRQAGNRATA